MKWPLAALAVIAFAFSHSSVSAQPSGRYEISGVVINAATGQLLDRADVTLHSPDSGSVVAETSTKRRGSFLSSNGWPRRSIRCTPRTVDTSRMTTTSMKAFSTAIVTGEGLVSGNLTFPLSPQAVISGVVTDDTGDPVQQAKVSLYRQNMRNGLGNIVRAGTVMTDDLGAYEFARLQPGNYYIAVSGSPWYATQPPQKMDRQGNLSDTPHSPLDVAFATTFYADVTDSDSATPIPVKAGDRIPVNFTLHAVPTVHILMQIPAPRGDAFSWPMLRQDVFGMSDRCNSTTLIRPRLPTARR